MHALMSIDVRQHFVFLLLMLPVARPSAAAEETAPSASQTESALSKQSASTGEKAAEASEPPTDWIDPATGHRIIRLSREPGTSSLYFHQNAYTSEGDKLFVTITSGRPEGAGRGGRTQRTEKGDAQNSGGKQADAARDGVPTGQGFFFGKMSLATIDLTTLGTAPTKVERIAEGFSGSHVVGRKSRTVYYARFELVDGVRVGTVFATNLDTHETREIGKLPRGRGGSGLAVNADETLLGGSFVDLPPGAGPGGGPGQAAGGKGGIPETEIRPGEGPSAVAQSPDGTEDRRNQEGRLAARLAQKLPMKLYTMDIKTGEVKTFAPSADWLNHVQFSPSDPKLMMICHEGPWHQVDRIWTVNVDDPQPRLMHPRSVPNEIAGHEFFSYDGRAVWYDLQTPRSGLFWLASVNLDDGKRLWYVVDRPQWSVHYNQSHDGKLFAGDGGGPESVANRKPLPENTKFDSPQNGQWIYLFRPQSVYGSLKIGNETVKIGKFDTEKLVDLSKHNYNLEPNLTFSPDNKWLIFRSNMHGPTHVYAVEIAKAGG